MGRGNTRLLIVLLVLSAFIASVIYAAPSTVSEENNDLLRTIGVVDRTGTEPLAAGRLYIDVESVQGVPGWLAHVYYGDAGEIVSFRVLCPPSVTIGGGYFGAVILDDWWIDGSPPTSGWGSVKYLKVYGDLRIVAGSVDGNGETIISLRQRLGYQYIGGLMFTPDGYGGFYAVFCPIVSIADGKIMVIFKDSSSYGGYDVHIYDIGGGVELYNYTVSLDTSLDVMHAYYVGEDVALLTTLYRAYLVSSSGLLESVNVEGTSLKVYRVEVGGGSLLIGSSSNLYLVNTTGFHPLEVFHSLDLFQQLEGEVNSVLYGSSNVVLPQGLWFKAMPLDYYWGLRVGYSGDIFDGDGFLIYNNWTILIKHVRLDLNLSLVQGAGSGGPMPVYYEENEYVGVPYDYFSLLLLKPAIQHQQHLRVENVIVNASVEHFSSLSFYPSYITAGDGYLLVYSRDENEVLVYNDDGDQAAVWSLNLGKPIGILDGKFFFVSGRELMSLNLSGGDVVDYGGLVPDWLPDNVEVQEGAVRGGGLFIPLYMPFGTPSEQIIAAIVEGSIVRFYHVPYQTTLYWDGGVIVLNRTLDNANVISLVDPLNGTVEWAMHIPRSLGSLYTFPTNTRVLMWAGPDGQGFMLLDPENDSIVLVPIPSSFTPRPAVINDNPALIYVGWKDVYAVELVNVTSNGRAFVRVYHVVLPDNIRYLGDFATSPDTLYVVAVTESGGDEILKITLGGGAG